jgi:uncharacterized OB-fold protein
VTFRPLPEPDELSTAYWAAAAEHGLALARCSRCSRFSHPPDIVCPQCHHSDPQFVFERVAGTGTVRSWVVMRQSFVPGFEQDVPFVLVDVAIDDADDVRLIGRLLDGPDTPLSIGDRVRLAFEDVTPEISIPAFALEATS